MSKVTAIENAIIQLGAGDFQEFCDTFLSKKEKYGAIHGLGKKSVTLKTTVGNPDTYFRNENGKYVCVAYTTQQDGIFKKLKEDIEKCLDTTKMKLSIDEIEKIVCCHTSSNLLSGEDAELHKLCESNGVKLTILSNLKGDKYIKHTKRIRNRIDMWNAQIKEEELQNICRKLYQ